MWVAGGRTKGLDMGVHYPPLCDVHADNYSQFGLFATKGMVAAAVFVVTLDLLMGKLPGKSRRPE
jgi:hypothetical protein